MKKTILSSFARRAAAFALALATLVPSELMSMPARAAEIKSTETKFVMWDWINDMQSIGSGADYDPSNEDRAIPYGETKYSRILLYRNEGGDRYYFNASPRGGNGNGYYTSYDPNKIYLDSESRVGNSSNKEWNSDMEKAETDKGSFLTKGGLRTPYLQYTDVSHDYHSWRIWAANPDDSVSTYAVMLEDDYEDLNVRRTRGGFSNTNSGYGAKDYDIRSDPWIINKKAHIVPQSRWKDLSNHGIWHWDNNTGGYDEALEFDLSDRKFRAWNIDTGDVDEFKIFLGKEYKVSTLAEDFTVQSDQVQTLGKPLYYIPKGRTITVEKDATLVIDGTLLNDGRIIVKEGGLLKLKDGAKVFPYTKYDNDCGRIDSTGNIIIGTDAVLCGSANNGIHIGKGGVVNFGVLCGESIILDRNDLIDNRVDDASDDPSEGWIIAGKSLSGAARTRFVQEAIANEGVTTKVDRSRDFAKISSTQSLFQKQTNSIYGDGASHVDASEVGKTVTGSISNPTLSVYTADRPGGTMTPLFENEQFDEVSLRVNGTKAVYTVRDKQYPAITNKLITAVIGRGLDRLTLFSNMWVGSLDGAYVQLEPANNQGRCMVLYNNGTQNDTDVVIYDRETSYVNKGHWWKLADGGKSGIYQTYVLESYAAEGKALDLPGYDKASSGANVSIYTKDDGLDQRWVLVPDAYSQGYYYFRSAANNGVSLSVDGTWNNASVAVAANNAGDSQRWRFVNLFDEESYSASVREGAAVDLTPQNATGTRLDMSGSEDGAGAVLKWKDENKMSQRWELRQAGTDNLDGVTVPYFRLVNKEKERALTVNGDIKRGASLIAKSIQTDGDDALKQYWYLQESGGASQYYVVPRGNTALVLEAPRADANVSVLLTTKDATSIRQMWTIAGASGAISDAENAQREAESDPFYNKTYQMSPANFSSRKLMGDASKTGQAEGVSLETDASESWSADWQLRYVGKDDTGAYYQLLLDAASASLALGVRDNDTPGNRVGVVLKVSNPADEKQLWRATKNDDGTYTIVSRSKGDVALGTVRGITVSQYQHGASYSYGAALVQGDRATDTSRDGWTEYEYIKAKWNLREVVKPALDGKTFMLVPKLASTLAMGAAGNSDADGANVELLSSAPDPHQRWTFAAAGAAELDGEETYCYTIKNAASGMALVGSADTNIAQKKDGTGKWFVVADDDGYCTLRPVDSERWIGAKDSGKTAGTNVEFSEEVSEGTRWKLVDPASVDFLDGRTFYLSPKHAPDKVLDLVGNGASNGTQVQIYDKKETEIQRWTFERIGVESVNGEQVKLYAIHSVYADGKVLDTSGSTDNGARPHLWDYDDTNRNQKWIVQDAGDGYYFIIPRDDTSKYLGVAGGLKTNNAAVELWNSSGDNRQWKLTETIVPETLGTYSILPKHAPRMHVGLTSSNSDNGTKLIIWEYNESSNYARWTFVKMGTDSGGAYYKIVNMANGKVIDATGNNTIQADSQLQQWDSDFNNDQLWYLNDAGQDENGLQYYNIVNRCDTNYCMSVSGGSTTHGTGVTVSKKNGGDSQKFRLMERFEPVELGTYEFGNPDAISMRLTVAGGSASDGANIILYARHTNNANAGGKLQQFKIIQRGNDVIDGVKTPYYSIENLNGGKVLDPISNANVSDGTNVQQWSYDGYSDQHWYMEVRGDNSVVFRCRADSRLALTATGTNSDDNVALRTYDEKNLGRQSWQLHPIMQTNADGQYYIPGNKNAVAAGIPNATEEDVILDPAVGGKYTITPGHAATMRVDLYGGSTDNGTKIQLYSNNGSTAQRWQLIPMGVDYFDGGGQIYYKLAFGSNANKVAQIDGYGPVTASKNVSLYDDQGCYDDLWYLEKVSGKEDTYYFIGRGTWSQAKKICLGVPAGAVAGGTQLQTATLQNKNYQQWQLEYVD